MTQLRGDASPEQFWNDWKDTRFVDPVLIWCAFYFQQPIYLNVRLRNGQGKQTHGSMDNVFLSVDTPAHPMQPLKKVISINGEVVDANDIENVDIHDFSTYEQEDLLSGQYIIRRKTFPQSVGVKKELRKQLSFQGLVRDIVLAEHVVAAFRRYKRRCDSETGESDTEDGDEKPRDATPVHASKTSSASLPGTDADASNAATLEAVQYTMENKSATNNPSTSVQLELPKTSPTPGMTSDVGSGADAQSGGCPCVVLW